MTTITTSAPGSIMITGEHAVVYGHRAIVCAVEQRITVTLRPRADREIHISSEIAPRLVTNLDQSEAGGPYRFVLSAIALLKDQLPTGFEMEIASQINPTLGLGSSSAVTIAALGAIATHARHALDGLHKQAHDIILSVQGRGSGADLAASLHGGVLAYRAPPLVEISALPTLPPLSLKYAGYKTPTAEVLRKIASEMLGREEEYQQLYEEMGCESDRAITAAQSGDWNAFTHSLSAYQTLMERLGVCDTTLAQIIDEATAAPNTLAAKISGSGLGDCIVSVGPPPPGFEPVTLAKEGLIIHD